MLWGWLFSDSIPAVEKEILMTRQEIMSYLRIKQGTLLKLMKQRAFPYIKLEKRVLFRKSDIDAYLEKHLVK